MSSAFYNPVYFTCHERPLLSDTHISLHFPIEYKMDYSSNYKLLPCYENFTQTGPEGVAGQANVDDESDDEPPDGDDSSEDHYALLVKAWEQKVFPTIRRRFRNEAERKDGLEQIRGALQLGMWVNHCRISV